MAQQKRTPEEQLLSLIEQEEDTKPLKLKRKKDSFFAATISSFLSLRKRAPRHKSARQENKEPNIKVLNRFLIGVSVVLSGCFIVDFTNSIKNISPAAKDSIKTMPEIAREDPEADVKPFLYYFEMGQRRNIFSPLVLKSTENIRAESEKILTGLMKDLILVGIFWGDEPQVVIEHKGEKKTYFLKSGDIINKLTIDAVLRDRVILNYEGETAELM
jgi:hypothetical protein